MASSMALRRLVFSNIPRIVRPAAIASTSSKLLAGDHIDCRSIHSLSGRRNDVFSGMMFPFRNHLQTYSSGVCCQSGQHTGRRDFSTVGMPSEKRNLRDHKRRLLAAKYELRRKLYKSLCSDPDLPSDMRDRHRFKLSKMPRNSSFVRLRNRCIFTGRPRAVYAKFRMSRIVFRSLASQGSLMGIKKASW
ncbi:hypothetical protein SLEP1_g54236 [Rubroshorea leprosula]|uniref:Small ribosomal subunit protein uS14m n=1 Tax=Rubroshorea leprosula TaxID=152421 RepID=A0AAV5MBY3_9ROSI|nr:hypothetical protein SLEP1_g54236 [Rubroshorea leprosula]